MDNVFRTKSGFCHVLKDKIVLSADGIIGHNSEFVPKNNMGYIITMYLLIVCSLFFFAFRNYSDGEMLASVSSFACGLFLVVISIRSKDFSTVNFIERDQIKEVHYYPGKSGITRARFVIHFIDHHGKFKKRRIMMPGTMQLKTGEVEEAVKMMKDHGYIS